jgi:hypothetical protein
MLETLDKFNIRTVVFSSSATVYQASNEPLREDAPLGPVNPYGQTKRMMEQIFQDICNIDFHELSLDHIDDVHKQTVSGDFYWHPEWKSYYCPIITKK